MLNVDTKAVHLLAEDIGEPLGISDEWVYGSNGMYNKDTEEKVEYVSEEDPEGVLSMGPARSAIQFKSICTDGFAKVYPCLLTFGGAVFSLKESGVICPVQVPSDYPVTALVHAASSIFLFTYTECFRYKDSKFTLLEYPGQCISASPLYYCDSSFITTHRNSATPFIVVSVFCQVTATIQVFARLEGMVLPFGICRVAGAITADDTFVVVASDKVNVVNIWRSDFKDGKIKEPIFPESRSLNIPGRSTGEVPSSCDLLELNGKLVVGMISTNLLTVDTLE